MINVENLILHYLEWWLWFPTFHILKFFSY